MRFLLLLSTVLLCINFSLAARNDAFIGYSEELRVCRNKARDCHEKARNQDCLLKPYLTRQECPRSCSVEICVYKGSLKVRFSGYATPEGTQEYQSRHLRGTGASISNYRSFNYGQGEVLMSTLGTGTYLGDSDKPTSSNTISAIIQAVQNGWNVIDTASNYRDGAAEAAVGEALAALLAGSDAKLFREEERYLHDVMRNMVFVSTKAGYVDKALIDPLIKSGRISVADLSPDGTHCLHPVCLEASLLRSRQRLRLDTVDLLYLHNPVEAQLTALGADGFKEALRKAFETLESFRTRGWIRAYGVSSWDSFRVPPDDPKHVSLASIARLAEDVGGADHGFKFLQLPINAAMPEAWLKEWQANGGGPRAALVDVAKRLGVGVVASAPFLEGEILTSSSKEIQEKRRDKSDPALHLELEALDKLPALGALLEARSQRLLQWSRSTPGVLSVVVGQTKERHVMSNLKVFAVEPLSTKAFADAFHALTTPLRGSGVNDSDSDSDSVTATSSINNAPVQASSSSSSSSPDSHPSDSTPGTPVSSSSSGRVDPGGVASTTSSGLASTSSSTSGGVDAGIALDIVGIPSWNARHAANHLGSAATLAHHSLASGTGIHALASGREQSVDLHV